MSVIAPSRSCMRSYNRHLILGSTLKLLRNHRQVSLLHSQPHILLIAFYSQPTTMSGNQSASKRPMDSAHDERPSKRSQSDGLTAVSPFNIKDGVKVEALADVWRAVPIMTEQRYIRDLAFLWDQTEIGDATIEEMHEQWFQVTSSTSIDLFVHVGY